MTDYQAHASRSDCLQALELDPVKETLLTYYGLPLSQNESCRFAFTTEKAFKENLLEDSAILGRYFRPRDHERFVLFDKGE